ncbi:hypothetical protein T11_17240 [Trichinella zimbabwensis]|uniref:Uncharacterized protein n=1 Tax=Trichinella zimbabwensis TaxID=268475 RepID=A0A0V1GWY3_9BILA|nr:hypothetical protein T11_17240 [Trichinella zimbabwensis]
MNIWPVVELDLIHLPKTALLFVILSFSGCMLEAINYFEIARFLIFIFCHSDLALWQSFAILLTLTNFHASRTCTGGFGGTCRLVVKVRSTRQQSKKLGTKSQVDQI